MKKLRMGILALTTLASIGTAFAFSPKARSLNTYFAEQTGASTWRWDTSAPAHKSCSPASTLQVTCQIQAATQPADNTMPAGIPVDNTVYK